MSLNTNPANPSANPPGIDVTIATDVANDVNGGVVVAEDDAAKNGVVDMNQAGAVNSSGDIGLVGAAPASPSIDFNLKMESARKAWENMPQSSVAPSNHQPSNYYSVFTI